MIVPWFCSMIRFCNRFQSTAVALKRLPLHAWHAEHKAKFVPFAGWHMPLAYDGLGALESTMHTRRLASLFDVSHMFQVEMLYKDLKKLDSLAVAQDELKIGHAKLALFLNDQQGIIDDCIVTRISSKDIAIVTNAATKDSIKSIYEAEKMSVKEKQNSLLALQGPYAAKILHKVLGHNFEDLLFMHSRPIHWKNCAILVSRAGYTGEDGFEMSIENVSAAQQLASELAQDERVRLAGLGARDILRMEAGLYLSGQDFDKSKTPLDAKLMWTLPKDKRSQVQSTGVELMGFVTIGPCPRTNCPIFTDQNVQVGVITSGTYSPHLKQPISLGYIKKGLGESQKASLSWKNRDNKIRLEQHLLPFVPHNYRRR